MANKPKPAKRKASRTKGRGGKPVLAPHLAENIKKATLRAIDLLKGEKAVGEVSGVTQSAINTAKKTGGVSVPVLAGLAKGLGLTMDQLLYGGAPDPASPEFARSVALGRLSGLISDKTVRLLLGRHS